MTKYVISGYIGFDNFGDEAIAQVLTSYLKASGAEKITVLSSNPEKTANFYGVDSVNFLKFLRPIIESDVLISGGGSLLQDITSLKSLIYYLAVITTALVLNKKVIIFAQGFTPFRTRMAKFFTKFLLQYCHKIYVRDSKSQEMLNAMDIDSELISDPVFGMATPIVENKKGIGIQLRSFPRLNDDFLQGLANIVSKRFPNERIKLFSLQDSLDMDILEKFARMLEKNNIESKIYHSLSVNETINELSKLEFLIGMRFHANLIAAKAGVKVLGINYDIKVSNLSNIVGFPIINLNEEIFEKSFEQLMVLDPQNYNIPIFKFPKI